ncbi:MAG: DUF4230 domain-containing protein [Deltaproteobacteria bacterium]|nr:DUF4230 domain-containing protein [Deltaproteobacteria bacterium]
MSGVDKVLNRVGMVVLTAAAAFGAVKLADLGDRLSGLSEGVFKVAEKAVFMDREPPEARVTEDAVIARVRRVAELSSVRYYVKDLLFWSEEGTLFSADKRFLLEARAVVRAGVDLSSGVGAKVDHTGERPAISVVLPAPRILSNDVTYRYVEKKGDVAAEDHNLALARARRNTLEEALQNGLLDQAANNARQVTAALLTALYPGAAVEVRFAGEDPAPAPEAAATGGIQPLTPAAGAAREKKGESLHSGGFLLSQE